MPVCQLDLSVSAGFNKFMAAAFGLPGTVKEKYGSDYGECLCDLRPIYSKHSILAFLTTRRSNMLCSAVETLAADFTVMRFADPFLNDVNFILSVLTLEVCSRRSYIGSQKVL